MRAASLYEGRGLPDRTGLCLFQVSAACVAAFLALALTFDPSSFRMFELAVAFASILAAAQFALILTRPVDLSLWEIYAAVLCLAYGLGTLIALADSGFERLPFLDTVHAWMPALAGATADVLFLASALLIFGQFDRSQFAPDEPVPSPQHGLVILLCFGLFAAAAVLMLTGQLGFQGDVSTASGLGVENSGAAMLVVEWSSPLGALAVLCTRNATPRTRRVLLACAAIMLLVILTQGRRSFAFAIVTYVIAFLAGRASSRIPLRKLFLALVVVGPLVAMQFYFFYAMRLTNWETGGKLKVQELVAETLVRVVHEEPTEITKSLQENVADRAFLLDYVAELRGALDEHPPLHGRLLAVSIASAIPSALWPGKANLLGISADEELVHPELGMPIWDAPNTLLTAGLSDFGIAGFFAYPIVVMYLFGRILSATRRSAPIIHAATFFALLHMVLNVEAGLAGFPSGLRHLTLLIALLWGMLAVYGLFQPGRQVGAAGWSPLNAGS